jgi:hypothetical protein
MLPVDPMLAKLRRRRIWTILHLLLLPVGIILIVIGGTSSSSSFGRDFLWSGLISILAFTFIFFQERFLRRIEQRRQEAAFGDQMLLAAEQPVPEAASLLLPTTIKLRLSKRFVLFGVVEMLVVVVLVGGYLIYSLMRNHFSSGFFIVIGLFLALFLITTGVAFAMISRQLSQQLDITEDGLTSRYMGTVSSIRWGEATLFATYAAFGAQKSKAISTYELSGANSLVKWTWYKYKGKNSFMSIRPTIPIDEYNWQMQALLLLVVARTGLPLYDLRKGKLGGGVKE